MLVGITSLGNYGYLARAYEKTHTRIALLERQSASLEAEIADTQKQIDGTRGSLNKTTDHRREDNAALNRQILEANELLLQSLARAQAKRQAAQERRDRDLQALAQQETARAANFTQMVAAKQVAIQELNARLAVLDRAVDAYTQEGGERFLKADSIKKGQELRDRQKFERLTITTQVAQLQSHIEQLRQEHAGRSYAADREATAVRQLFTTEMAQRDDEEKDLRQARIATLVQATQQLNALQVESKATAVTKDSQVDALYDRIRARNAEIHNLRVQIADVDIGSYRFVARAFEAGADDVVKWLILALVFV
ncbi:MAG: hypothetical protein NTV49_03355, partial [Kiritimatiellaeota bacterium]|nr:hypothetical protein [Kiritimatiellota bacterium]